jgi:putative DNA primase/helicase
METITTADGRVAEGLRGPGFTEPTGTGINKKAPAEVQPAGAGDFRTDKVDLSMSNHSTSAAARVGQNSDDSKQLDKLIQQLRDKLNGVKVKIKPPAGEAFKADGPHAVWGYIARQAVQADTPESTREAIENVLTDQPERAAEVWGLLEPEPVILPVPMAEGIDDEDYGESEPPPDTDMARGLLLLPYLIGKVRWVQEWEKGGWLYWNGKRWERNAAAVERLAKKILPRIAAEKLRDYDAIANAARKAAIMNAIWWVRCDPRILTPPELLDANPWLLNLDNGTLNLQTMELQPHNPDDLCTKISPTAYDAAAECPLFRKTLEKFVPDKEIRDFLLQHFGSCLTGVITHLKLPILYGHGRNGKSTITNSIAGTLGPDYAITLDSNVLTDDGSKSRTSDRLYHIASIHGKRLVVVNELEENCILRGPQLKELVSVDKLTGRRPYEMPFSFWPSHKCVMLTNHKPRLRSTEDGTMRRIALVPFDVQIQPGEDDKAFGEKLKAEAAGILNMLVEGCKDWQNKGNDAPVPAAITAATESYRHDEDVIGRFIADCIKVNSLGFVTGKKAYDTFKTWCDDAGIEPISGTSFGRKFGAKYEKTHSKNGAQYAGIIINPEWKPAE